MAGLTDIKTNLSIFAFCFLWCRLAYLVTHGFSCCMPMGKKSILKWDFVQLRVPFLQPHMVYQKRSVSFAGYQREPTNTKPRHRENLTECVVHKFRKKSTWCLTSTDSRHRLRQPVSVKIIIHANRLAVSSARPWLVLAEPLNVQRKISPATGLFFSRTTLFWHSPTTLSKMHASAHSHTPSRLTLDHRH